MSQQKGASLYRAAFMYDEAALNDFEAMYRYKREMPKSTRAVLGGLGAAGALFFGWQLYRNGPQATYVLYLLICSLLLLLAFSKASRRPDDAPAKYRRAYQNRHVTFTFDDEGLEMRLEGQKNYARSKYKEIYGLFDTDLCFYFTIKGRAHYILPKAAVDGGRADELRQFMEKKCRKKFQHIDVGGK